MNFRPCLKTSEVSHIYVDSFPLYTVYLIVRNWDLCQPVMNF